MTEIMIHPIGVLESELEHRYETPRQGILSEGITSVIKLFPKNNFEQALKDLEGFERIWVIYQFHLNKNWKPLVTPPRHTRSKIGVFATRSPHRPNHIGLSCVKLERIDKLNIYISGSDILNGSPILDIKPYLPYSDSFPNVKTGWVKSGLETIFKVVLESKAVLQTDWLKKNSKINLVNFAKLQLEFSPTDASRKRISNILDENLNPTNNYVLAYRTWRIIYLVDEESKKVIITEIKSGYSKEELLHSAVDKYEDKELHNNFIKHFNYD